MRARLSIFVLLPIIGTSISPAAFGQGAPERVQRPPQDFIEIYLEGKQREFQGSQNAAQSRNLGAQSTAIYNLLREKGPFASFDVRGKDAAQKQKVRDALTRTVAYFLTGIGLTANKINDLERSGLDPLQSGANIIGSTPKLEDALTVSPIAVVAEVTANTPGANPVERQLTFSPRRVVKGHLAEPFSISLRLPAPVSSAREGSQYLLFLSSEYGPFQRAAGRKSSGTLEWVALPYELQGGSYVPVSPGQDPASRSVNEIDAFMARHPAIFKSQ